jgi:hypothetical protein
MVEDLTPERLQELYEDAQRTNDACAKIFVKVYGNSVGRYRWFGVNRRERARARLNRNKNKKNFYRELDREIGKALGLEEDL